MKKYFLLSTFLCFSFLLFSQDNQLLDFNQARLQKQKSAMMILGGWAVGNIAVGLTLRGQHQGVEREFHNMNIGWNVVNLGIATFGYVSALKSDPAAMDLYSSIQEQNGFQKTLLFNAGLDIGYMLGGAYLIERSKNATKNADRLKGFGRSIILQGGFLFVFDVVNYIVFSKDNVNIKPLLGMDAIGQTQFGVSWVF
ncbi:MAG: hypothetical protein AAFO07_10735 [Bacteroidota bacterium]